MKKTIILLLAAALTGCTQARRAKFEALGKDFKVEMVNCDGSVTHQWISSGKVFSEESSDGYYFNDKATGKLVEISGHIIITPIN